MPIAQSHFSQRLARRDFRLELLGLTTEEF
jgi:hypothetical protein